MERERGGGDDEVEHEVDGEEVREEARREDVAEDLGQIELGRVWHDRESERLKRMRSARPDRPGAGRAPATSPAPSVSPKRNGYLGIPIKILSFSLIFFCSGFVVSGGDIGDLK